MKTILVFKTSVTHQQQVQQVSPLLNQLMGPNEKWNFDLEDCDNILRVEAIRLSPGTIVQKLDAAGYFCAELPD